MNNGHTNKRKSITDILLIAGITALGVVFTITLHAAPIEPQSQAVQAGNVAVPPLPPDLQEVPPPHEVAFVGHAIGTQNYVCLPSGPGVAWTLFTPQATLFRDNGQQLTTHFFSPNPDPDDNLTVRAAWQHSRDSSTVWGRVTDSSDDANFVAQGAIPWLTVETAGVQEGPTGIDVMTAVTFIQRLNTVDGIAPATGCSVATDVGKRAFVPYRADYFFYTDPTRHGRKDGR